MTDKTATERLREMLDESGELYTTNDEMGYCETSWRGFTAYQLTPGSKLITHPTPEQAIAATLGIGKLTAEQVRKAIFIGGVWDEDNAMCLVSRTDMQAITDELNATLGSGGAEVDDALALLDEIREAGRITYDDYSQLHDAISVSGGGMCRIEWRDDSHDTESGYEHDGAYFCTNCGADLPYPLQECWDDYQAGNGEKPFDCCPHCGKVVNS